MSQKKIIRARFREAVFNRDGHKCKICGSTSNLDAHHIINRNFIYHGGYVAANGISLCDVCHPKAEEAWDYNSFNITEPELSKFYPDELFNLIGSSKELAEQESERWLP